ncbi:hypothetical protein GUJ93_ZPchr0004g39950 [Zizania palustris]|uniref:4-coumarate--CoA ligase n=1 Tax=Zizania palustris TaxID=103762 RepID=A0A8J5STD5_ZIZPA|nr:hypothetical protein GUJ93_ZPchr0004g39950 [Zizania palustris]
MDKLGAKPANSRALTPLGFLERAAAIVYGDCPSVVYYHDTVFTWSQTLRRCLRVRLPRHLPPPHLSVLLPNVPAMYEMHFGVPMSGAVLNSINTRLDARTVAVLLRHSGSKLIFVDPVLLPVLRDALRLLPSGHPAPRVILVDDPHEREFPPAPATTLTYERLLEKGDPEFAWLRPVSEWDPMILNYTSGTTSPPKGVPTYLWTLPLGVWPWWAAPTSASAASTPPPEGVRKPLPGKVRIRTSGAPPPAAVLYRTEAIGFEVSHRYGLTETAGLVLSCAWKGEWDKLPGSERARLKARQGVRTAGMSEVDIVDSETGRSVPRDGSTMG